jgi:ABC-2 type transport system permease protein
VPSYSYVRKSLRDDRRAVLGWAAGVAVFVAIYASFWSQFEGDSAFAQSSVQSIPEGMRNALGWTDYATAAGYLNAVIFTLFAPLLVIMCAVVLGNRTVAVPEEAGTLDLLLANPVSRRRFLLERFAALTLGLAAVNAVALLVTILIVTGLDMGIPVGNLIAAWLGVFLLSLCFGAVALTAGSAVGRRGVVLATAGALAVGTYLIRALGIQAEAIRPLRWLSPFHYYLDADALRSGLNAGYLLVLAGIVVALVALAVVLFDRRDLGT